MYEPKPFEAIFELKPIGVKRICEHCGKGEMKAVFDEPQQWPAPAPNLIKHVCTECGGVLRLPKMYPYIEWVNVEEDKNA
jgi:hypothetical protein